MARLPDCIPAPRLTLRRWLPDDGPDLSAAILQNLDHLRPWMPWIKVEPQSLEDRLALINEWQADWEAGGDVVIGAFLEGKVIGSAGLHRRRGPGVLEIGYWVRLDHVKKGFATEIAEALTTAAFSVEGIDRVEIHHDKANIASGGVPRRLGYAFGGETRDSVTSPGEVGIDCRWLITSDRWTTRSTTGECC
ncbi:MAG: GNAT family N-acetyltransferase [Ilumatobacteraceae bacterium]